jgi:hypothetical protein
MSDNKPDPYRAPEPEEGINPYAAPRADVSATVLPGMPRERFSIDGAVRLAWRVYRDKFTSCVAVFLGATGVVLLFGWLLGTVVAFVDQGRASGVAGLVFAAGFYVAAFWAYLGQMRCWTLLARGRDVSFDEFVEGGRSLGWFLVATLLASIAVYLVSLAAIVPATFAFGFGARVQGAWVMAVSGVLAIAGLLTAVAFSVRVYQYPYLLVDRRCGALESLRGSWSITRGHVLELTAVYFLAGLIGASGFLACGVGLLFTLPLAMLILACAYVTLADEEAFNRSAKVAGDVDFGESAV